MHKVSLADHLLNRNRRGPKCEGVDEATIDIVICSSYAIAEYSTIKSRLILLLLASASTQTWVQSGTRRGMLSEMAEVILIWDISHLKLWKFLSKGRIQLHF